ncbi:UNVERIFIED_CONTAM: hypothetical protein GTU68_027220 [Idotea baltica]|nr:hypothetical protein [Idotea baltica]
MRQYMAQAPVGDDVFGQDPSVNELEEMLAKMFGKEAAIFCPSGTMTNQIAILNHTKPLDEVICDKTSHVYQYETSGYAFNSRVGVKLLDGVNGKITPSQISEAINPDYDWLPKSSLVVIENSCNKGGGSFYTLEEIASIRNICNSKGLKLHLDGARLFNVLVETDEDTVEVGKHFDSISICLSKGLGAPVGSVLIGEKNFIKQARRYRKVLGGGMRQAGIIAAGGIFALKHNIERLKIDNDRAKEIGETLGQCNQVELIHPVQTNILIFELKPNYDVKKVLNTLEENNIIAAQFGPKAIRFVFHMDISQEMLDRLRSILPKILNR